MRRHRIRSGQTGWVSVEMAFAALGIALAIVAGAGLFNLCLTQIGCADTAAVIARQAARADTAAVDAITGDLPDSVMVTIKREGREVVVTVRQDIRPWGDLLPSYTVEAQSRALVEGEP